MPISSASKSKILVAGGALALLVYYLYSGNKGYVDPQAEKAAEQQRAEKIAAKEQEYQQTKTVARAMAQLDILSQVLASKNDNDPRLDTELRELSPEAKDLFMRRYQELPREDRNARGTIVFLIGRNLERQVDFDFLQAVIEEPPCASLENCSSEVHTGTDEAAHHEDGVDTTLLYPQVVVLRSLEQAATKGALAKPLNRDRALRVIQAAIEKGPPALQDEAKRVASILSEQPNSEPSSRSM